MKRYRSAIGRTVAVAAAALAAGSAPGATAIPGLFNTGVDSNNVALVGGDGVIDPHYRIAFSTFPGAAGRQAVTLFRPSYAAEDADSRWISYAASGHTASTVTLYRLTFDLTGFDHTTAQISGHWGADNAAALILNGSFTGRSVNNVFASLAEFTLTSGFRPGLNHLEFQVADAAPPTAFRLDNLFGTAVSTLPPPPPLAGIPEPASWALMIGGFFGAGSLQRRRGRAALA